MTFQDGLFAPHIWVWGYQSTPGYILNPNSAWVTQTNDFYGNPAPYRRIYHSHGGNPTPSHVVSWHINNQATYTPYLQGAIGSVEYEEHARTLATEGGVLGAVTRMALEQNGNIYVSANATPTHNDLNALLPSGYKSVRFTGLTAASFGRVIGPGQFDFTQNPNFTSSGSAVRFGFARHSSHTRTTLITRVTAIDNWSVTVHQAAVAPAFLRQPSNQTVAVGSTAFFQVLVTGTIPMRFQWYHQGAAIPGATNTTLTLQNVQASQAGSYHVTASNAGGTATSATAILTVGFAPSIQVHPQDATVRSGDPVSFSVTATGTPTFSYQWHLGGIPIPGATSNTYAIASAQASDAGDYYVTIGNAFGSVTSLVARLTIDTAIPPVITTHPVNQSVTAGDNVTFSVMASGTPPLAYQWKKNNFDLPGATSATLTLLNVRPADSANYSVEVANSAGSTISMPAFLTVLSRSKATRNMPPSYAFRDSLHPDVPFDVSIDVQPDTSVSVQVIEDSIPHGWTVLQISHQGAFDANARKVKWGPFFGANPQSLQYSLMPPPNSFDPANFAGLASFDGSSVVIGGPDQALPKGVIITRNQSELIVCFSGMFLLEATNPAGPYTIVPGATNPYRVPASTGGNKYYKTSN